MTLLSVGFVVFFLGFYGNTCSLLTVMEILTKHWRNLSLNDTEGRGLHLTKERDAQSSSLLQKYLTKRVLNTEAIIRTFNPLWRSRNRFEVRNADDHVVLFLSEEKEEVDKILPSEPWGFNKYLMML